ncbi:dihydroneopterin aldolase [Candidatus Omnitrophota bacterium]
MKNADPKLTTITINELTCNAIIGTNECERNTSQQIITNIQFTYDARAAIYNDDLTQTIDYDTLTQQIIKHIETSTFFLIETLVDSIITLIMEETRIITAEVSVSKPKAIESAESVTVTRLTSRT